MKVSREQFKMFQQTCKRFNIPKDSIHLNLKKLLKTCRNFFKRRYVLTTCLVRRKNRSVLVRWVKRVGFFPPKQKQSLQWKRMRSGHRWTEAIKTKREATVKKKKSRKSRSTNNDIVRRQLKKLLQQMGQKLPKREKQQKVSASPKVVVEMSKKLPVSTAKSKTDDDWWGEPTKKAKSVASLNLLSSDEENQAAQNKILELAKKLEEERAIDESTPQEKILSVEECNQAAQNDILEMAKKLEEENTIPKTVSAGLSAYRKVPKTTPVLAASFMGSTTSSTDFQLVKPMIATKPRASFNFIDSLINKLKSSNPVETAPVAPVAHCSKTNEPKPQARVDQDVRDKLNEDFALTLNTNEQSFLESKKKVHGPRKKLPAANKSNSLALFDDLPPEPTSDNEFLGFDHTEIGSSKSSSPAKYKNINHSAFLGSDTNFEDLNLDDNNLLEPMSEVRLNDGMVSKGTKGPNLQLPQRPDNMKKPRTVAEKKKIMSQNKCDIRFMMIENESKIFHELTKRNRLNENQHSEGSDNQGQGSTSWARSVEGKNFELMIHLQNQDVPFSRDSWRALAFLKTEDKKYYFRNLRIDGHYVKLSGSKGNHDIQILADQRKSWPEMRYRTISRSAAKKCCSPIELPKNLLVQLIVNDEMVSFVYDLSRRRRQEVKTYKLPADQLSLLQQSPSKCLLDPSTYRKPGPLSSKLRKPRRLSSCDDAEVLFTETTEKFKMPTVQLEVFPKLDVPLDDRVIPYLKMLLPFKCITQEWANFALSTFMPSLNSRQNRRRPSEPISYTFDMPYVNDEKQIIVKKRQRMKLPIRKLNMLDKHLNLDVPLEFAANIDRSDEDEIVIAEMLTEICNAVAISCNEDAFTQNDPDLVYDIKEETDDKKVTKAGITSSASGSVGKPKMETADETKNKIISRRVMRELQKLNATFITASNSNDMNEKKKEICTQDFCIKGCICESLNQYLPAIRNKHCSKAACMFECRCGFTEEINDLNSLTNADVRSLRDKATAYLAPVEKEFTPTVVLTNNRPIIISGKEHEARRFKKAPKRYDDFLISKEEETAASEPIGRMYKPGGGARIPGGRSPPDKCQANVYESRVEQMLHVNVVLNRLDELTAIEPFCMVHRLYKCYCCLQLTSGIPFNFHNPQSIEEAAKICAKTQRTPNQRNAPSDPKMLQQSKRAAEIDHGAYNAPPHPKRTRSFGNKDDRSRKRPLSPDIGGETLDAESTLDSLIVDPELTDRAQRCLPVSRFYKTRNHFQKDHAVRKVAAHEKQQPETLVRLRELVDKCLDDYKEEIHRQRLGFPKLEIECTIAETTNANDPVHIYIKDSDETVKQNPVLKKLADGQKMLIFTGNRKYYIQTVDYKKNENYLIGSLRKQTTDPIYVIQRDPKMLAAQSMPQPEAVLPPNNTNNQRKSSIQRLNLMTTATMQNICDIQRENSKQLMEPRVGQLYIYGWQHLLKGFEQNLLYVWEVTFHMDHRAVVISLTQTCPVMDNVASAVNVRSLTLTTQDVSLVTRLLLLRLDNEQTKNLALLLKGTTSFWTVCGFLKSKENYVDHGLKVRPTPNTHPRLSKKISSFFDVAFNKKPISLIKNKTEVTVNNNNLTQPQVKMPVISAVSSGATQPELKLPIVSAVSSGASQPELKMPVISSVTSLSQFASAKSSQSLLLPQTVPSKKAGSSTPTPMDLESALPITSISKGPVLTSETLNADFTNIDLVQKNINNTLALPYQTFPHRWYMLSVINDFSDIYIPEWKSYLAYDKILRAITMAQRVRKTVQLQSNSQHPQVFAVPESANRIFLGPYMPMATAHLKLCQNIDGKMMLREDYQQKYGITKSAGATTGCWLYLKSIKMPKKLPVAIGDVPVNENGPKIDDPVPKLPLTTLIRPLTQRIASKIVTGTGSELRSILLSSNINTVPSSTPVVSATKSLEPSVTSSCVINHIPVLQTAAPTVKPANPVGHLANQQIFPKFNIKFTTANKNLSMPPAAMVAARSQPLTKSPEPVINQSVSEPPSPLPTTENIDLTEDDQSAPTGVEIDLTSDDETANEEVGILKQSNNGGCTVEVSSIGKKVCVIHDNCVGGKVNCQVCSTITINEKMALETQVPPMIQATKIDQEIRKQFLQLPTGKSILAVPPPSEKTTTCKIIHRRGLQTQMPTSVATTKSRTPTPPSSESLPMSSIIKNRFLQAQTTITSTKPTSSSPTITLSDDQKRHSPKSISPVTLKERIRQQVLQMRASVKSALPTKTNTDDAPKVLPVAKTSDIGSNNPRSLLNRSINGLTEVMPMLQNTPSGWLAVSALQRQSLPTLPKKTLPVVTATITSKAIEGKSGTVTTIRNVQLMGAQKPNVVDPKPSSVVSLAGSIVPTTKLMVKSTSGTLQLTTKALAVAKSLGASNTSAGPLPTISKSMKAFEPQVVTKTVSKVVTETKTLPVAPTSTTSVLSTVTTAKVLPVKETAVLEKAKPSRKLSISDRNVTGESKTLAKLAIEDDTEPSQKEHVLQFGYFVSSFIFLGRLKAKEVSGNSFVIRFPSLKPNEPIETFEWRVTGSMAESSRIINNYIQDLVYATVPRHMTVIWKFISHRNVFNSYKDHTALNFNKNTIMSKHGVHNLFTSNFDKFAERDMQFYEKALFMKLSLTVMNLDQEDEHPEVAEVVMKSRQMIGMLRLEEMKLIQLKKTCSEKNTQLRLLILKRKHNSLTEKPKLVKRNPIEKTDDVVDLDTSDEREASEDIDKASTVSEPTTFDPEVSITKRKSTSLDISVAKKNCNVNIINKLPKDLTVSKMVVATVKTPTTSRLAVDKDRVEKLRFMTKQTLAPLTPRISVVQRLEKLKNMSTKRKSETILVEDEPAKKVNVPTRKVGNTFIRMMSPKKVTSVIEPIVLESDDDSDSDSDSQPISEINSSDFLDTDEEQLKKVVPPTSK